MCNPDSRSRSLVTAAGLLVVLAALIMPASVRGDTLTFQKVSEDSGGLGGPLPDNGLFGQSAEFLGDISGDSNPELAVGFVGDSPGITGTGAVYVLTLSTVGTVLAERVINGGDIGNGLLFRDNFGSSVEYLGDLDGPGPATHAIAVGANAGAVPSRTGAVWILFLDGSGSVLSYRKISAADGLALNLGDSFGVSLASLGDLDGVGLSVLALAVGATGDEDGCSSGSPGARGAVWILFLNADGSVFSHQKISGTSGGFTGDLDCEDYFSESIAPLGDLDGPGGSATAIAVGALFDDDWGTNSGAVWILFLNSNGTVASFEKTSGPGSIFASALDEGDRLGSALDAVGDLDGDGVIDLVVGADSDEDGDTPAPGTVGAAYVVYLQSDGTAKSYQKISETQGGFTGGIGDGGGFGSAVSGLGDLNSDGMIDVCIGEAQDSDGGHYRGAVWNLFLPHSGACCFGSICRDLWQVTCESGDGTYVGDDSTCDSACTQATKGACCFGEYCLFLPQCDCESNGGFYIGDGALCTQEVCAPSDVPAWGSPASAPSAPKMSSIAPNPSQSGARLTFALERRSRARVRVYDPQGRLVETILDSDLDAGSHAVEWSGETATGKRAASGVYFVDLSSDDQTERHRIVLIR